MKKFVVITLSLIVALLFSACSCSCSQESSLKFNNAWFSTDENKEPQTSYEETCEYEVELIKDFNEDGLNYSVNEYVANSNFIYDYKNGRFISKITVLPTTHQEVLNISTDILGDEDGDGYIDVAHIIKFETEFSIDSEFTYGDMTEPEKYSDYINSVVYFCPENSSYTPIYSTTEYSYQTIRVKKGAENKPDVTIKTISGTNVISFSKNSYTLNDKEYKKLFKTYIDNNQLLFALRNINIEADGTFNLPTVSAQYGIAKDLTVTRMTDRALDISFNEGSKSKNTKRFNFKLANSSASGQAQLVYVNNSTDVLDGKAVIMRYVSPMVDAESYFSLGALQYTLTSYSAS